MPASRKHAVAIGACVIAVFLLGAFLLSRRANTPDRTMSQVLAEYGFTELRPPSLLLPPGTLISPTSDSPLIAEIICPQRNALCEETSIEASPTATSDLRKQFSGRMVMSQDYVDSLRLESRFNALRSISMSLSNVAVLEISDDIVFDCIADRKSSCRQAVQSRLDGGLPVSMVKKVLRADVRYDVRVESSASASTKAAILNGLSAELGGETEQNDHASIQGDGLYWGIVDSRRLGEFQPDGSLPPAGTETDSRLFQAATPLKIESPIIAEASGITPVKQSSQMSCWAASLAMLHSWRQQSPIAEKDVVTDLGAPWDIYYETNAGLQADDVASFADAAGLIAKPPANYTVKGYAELIRDHGPLWITTSDLLSAHAMIVTGVRGHGDFLDSDLRIVDPATGKTRWIPAADYAHQFELETRRIVNLALDDTPFRLQILHIP